MQFLKTARRAFALALLPLVFAPVVAEATQYQQSTYTVWDNSKYYLDNQTNGNTGGTQVFSGYTSSNNGIQYKLDWNWVNTNTNHTLKYPSTHMGWHWGYPDHYPSTTTGLPFQIASGKKVYSTWQYNFANSTVSGKSNGWNVSYDLWFHWKAAPTWQDQPNYEIMIWNAWGNGQQPVGSKIADNISISGKTYELWVGPVQSWQVFTFRSKVSADSAQNTNITVTHNNLVDFVNYVVNSNNSTITATGINKWVYLTSIQAGTEQYNGQGHLYTWWYESNVQ